MLNGLTYAERHQPPGGKKVVLVGTVITKSDAVERAVRRMVVDYNIPVITAAGDGYLDACQVAPPSEPYSYSVSGTDVDDQYARPTNFGRCVNNFAPGSGVKVASHQGHDHYQVTNGSHVAAGHVAGVAALLLGRQDHAMPVMTLYARLNYISQQNVIKKLPKQTVNQLINIVQLVNEEEMNDE